MDHYIQNEGERPDLAAIEVNPPEGYIADTILPVVPVTEPTGVVYYRAVTADSAAQTGRVAGAAPGDSRISTSNTTFTAAECIKRGSITPDEVKTMGGLEKAEAVGAKWAKRQVMNYLEADVANLILGGTADAQFDAAKVQTDVQDALEAIRLYEGPSALIGSTWTIKAIMQNLLGSETYGPALARLVTGASGVQAVQGISLEAWKQALAIFFGVDKVLAGCDTVWNASAIKGHFAIAKVDDGTDELAHKWKPILGKRFQFLPDGANPWSITAIPDRLNIDNHWDAKLRYDAVILNSHALYLFDGVSR